MLDNGVKIAFADEFAPHILEDYYNKRDSWAKERLGLPDAYHGFKDKFDDSSYIIVATDGHECLGGLRVSVCRAEKSDLLPMEAGGLRLHSLFPELSLGDVCYAEISRLIIKKGGDALSYENTIGYQLMQFLLGQEHSESDIQYVFSIAPKQQSRLYAMMAKLLQIKCQKKRINTELLPKAYAVIDEWYVQLYDVKHSD